MGAGHATPTAELPPPQFLSLVPLVFQGTCQGVPSHRCRAAQRSLGLAFVSRQAGGGLWLGRGLALAGQAVGPWEAWAQPEGSMSTSGGLCVPGAAHQGL